MQQKQLQKVLVFQFCLVLFAAFSARAGEAARYDGPEWEFLDVKKACAVARDVTVAKYPDSDEATLAGLPIVYVGFAVVAPNKLHGNSRFWPCGSAAFLGSEKLEPVRIAGTQMPNLSMGPCGVFA